MKKLREKIEKYLRKYEKSKNINDLDNAKYQMGIMFGKAVLEDKKKNEDTEK